MPNPSCRTDCWNLADWSLVVVNPADGRVMDCNPAFLSRFAATGGAGSDWTEALELDERAAAAAWLSGQAGQGQAWQGSARQGAVWWRVQAHRMPGIEHLLLDVAEVTREAEAAERRRLEAEHFHALIERSVDGVSIFDAQAKILYESPANKRIHGYESAEMEGRNLFDFCHPEDLARVMPRFVNLAKGPGVVETDIVRFRHKAGHYIYLEGTVLNATDDPRVNGLVNNFRDVTRRIEAERELRRAKEAAEEAHRLQRHFLANLSHEFKTPLTLIRGPITSLAEGRIAADRQPESFALVLRNIERLDALLTELIDLARLEAGTFALCARQQDIVRFARRTTENFSPLAQEKGVALRMDMPPACAVFFDAPKLEKVLGNFLSNALKFSPPGSTVRVTVRVLEDADVSGAGRVEVEVRDSGPGMNEATRSRVFERFFQGESGNSRSHEGMGIGLALAREMVELHGGTVRVESEPGHGSAFTFALELGCEHLDPDDIDVSAAPEPRLPVVGLWPGWAKQSQSAPPENGHRPRLLLIEDNADMRAYLRLNLEPFYLVSEAVNGAMALDHLESVLPEVIVSDVMMPQIDGLEFCRRLRALEDWRSVPVLMLSAKGSAEHRVEGLQAGADDYLAKPFSMAELLQRLKARCPWGRGPEDADRKWREDLLACMDANLGSSEFDVEELARMSGLSARQLRRRVLAHFDEVPAALLISRRLQRAHALILERRYSTISEVAHAVGLSPGYFSRRYRKVYGSAEV